MIPLISAGLTAPPWCIKTHMHTQIHTHTHSHILSHCQGKLCKHTLLSAPCLCVFMCTHVCLLRLAKL